MTTSAPFDEMRRAAHAVLRRDPENRAAHLRLYEVEQILGRPAAAVAHLRRALQSSRVVTLPARRGPAARSLLALSRVAPWEANVPLELVYDEETTTLHRFYLDDDDDDAVLALPVPPFDVAFNTIAESDRARPVLALAERWLERRDVVALNRPEAVAALSRDDVAARFAASTTVLAPAVRRVGAGSLAAEPPPLPAVIRPVGSQAGIELERIADRGALHAYLGARAHPAYYVAPFVDYASHDGFYRKYRVMFVGGVALPCHLAISPRWMIHYYNAPMAEHSWMRDEEAHFLARFDDVFSGRARAALDEIAAATPLDYFGIDCALLADGRVLLFEADAAMLVHNSDPSEVFPYKQAAFERIKGALASTIGAHARLREQAR